ncbi:tetratricopeptide repeat protein [Proteiniphilum sp.]|uniref:tetratricopeptide repeat protein n=1 Tax=Proteiniphilum sp. TaxID=1926877 RepID=UPI002B1FDE71|nr:tetratricopeptide repeat protein [Proteiniphilum sp.]MEA4916064.1 tetratricopeptide repeat protein [Proteiniphilum sp.]
MTEDSGLSRVQVLLEQRRYVEADHILRDMLTTDAENIQYLYLLAEANLQLGKYDTATNIIDNAIGLSPDVAGLFYTKSRIAYKQGDYDEAEKNIRQSIALDPYDADYFALLANIKLTRKQYNEALEFANKALEIDPENILGLNTRSTALLKLNRSEESFNTIEGALREDPNNAYTHANYGWGLLEKGDHKKALEHFKESLKNNPDYSYAQSGMLEALKAANPIYRAFLKYAFWMEKHTARYQWGIIIGFYFVVRFLNTTAQTNDSLQPYLIPVVILLSLIAFSTWIIGPISNLFLRFNVYGQLLLDKKEKMSSNFVAGALFTCVAGMLLYFILSDVRFLTIALFGFVMMVPFSVIFLPSKSKYLLPGYSIALGIAGILAVILAFSTGMVFNLLTLIFIIGFFIFQWVANFAAIKNG